MIVFNALQTSLNGGIGRYSYELAKNLYNINSDSIKIVIREQDLKLFSFAKKEDLIIVKNINNSRERNLYEQFKLPKLIYKKYPEAIIHYPDTMAPIFAKNECIITIHDLAFKSLKGAFTWKSTLWKNIMTNLSVKKSKKIIAITNFTKNEILNHYPKINKDKISVVYNGFNDFSKEIIEESKVRDSIKEFKKNYILTVSTISPRKNIDGLIKAFNLIKEQIEENLIIAGGNGWMYQEVYDLVDKLNLNDRVIFTGKVNDEELKYLYKNARIFTYVSFYEGFGLPPLEAMSYGLPCIVSDMSSIPEVVGDEVIKVDPKNNELLARELFSLISNEGINKNYDAHLEKFSWKKCSQDTFNVYNE